MFSKRNLFAVLLAVALVFTAAAALAQVEGAMSDLPDVYTHATDVTSKEVLTGDQFEAAMQFLVDSSHYWYINRGTPYYGNYTKYPETGFDTEWRSPVNGRGYRGPYYDPLTRSVNWLTTNPNGSINSSVGSYWACIAPNTDLVIENNECQGYEKSDKYQMICVMSPGQTVDNFIRNGRGSLYIDASLVNEYDVEAAWEYRNILMVEVELDHYVPRFCSPEEYYNGEIPTTSSWLLAGRWAMLEGWDGAEGHNTFLSIPQFWGCATGDAAALNLTTDEERAAYLELCNSDPAVIEACTGVCYYMHFNVLQVINNKQELGFDFEQASGKVNAIDKDHDGMLDVDENGEVIALNMQAAMLPSWAYRLNQNLDWWIAGNGDLINSEGRKLIGAKADGTYILEGEEIPEGAYVEDANAAFLESIELADNQKAAYAKGNNGMVFVRVTLDGDTITAVEVVSHNETAGLADGALAEVPAAIVAANSTDVDTVSGATNTSKAIIEAVKLAIAK